MTSVLIIEERVDSAAALQTLIHWEEEGYELLGVVSNGIVGRAIVERQMPDIILLSTTSLYMGGASFITAVNAPEYSPQIIQLYSEMKTVISKDIPETARASICRGDLTAATLRRALSRAAMTRRGQGGENSFLPVSDVRNEALADLLYGRVTGAVAHQTAERLGLNLAGASLSAALFYPSGVRPQGEIVHKQLANLFGSVLNQHNGGEVFALPPGGIGVIIRAPESADADLAHRFFSSVIHALRRVAESQLGLDVSVVWLEDSFRLETIAQGFSALCRLARYRFFLPDLRFLSRRELEARATPANYEPLERGIASLEEGLDQLDKTRVSATLSHLYLTLVRPTCDFEVLRYLRERFAVIYARATSGLPLTAVPGFPTATFANLEQEYLTMRTCFRDVISELSAHRNQASPQIRKVTDYLAQNYASDISLESAAACAGVSSGYLSRLFRREMNISFVGYLAELRMNRARSLLCNPDLHISDIASSVGYPDAKYFCRFFRRLNGCSPAEYRQARMKRRETAE